MGPGSIFIVVGILLFLFGKRRAAFWTVGLGLAVGLFYYAIRS